MLVVLFILGAILLHGVAAVTVDDASDVSIARPIACIFLCILGKKCVIVEPQNCVGCQQVPQCVQQEYDTSCNLKCPFFSKCVLVATNCCPKPTCRRFFPYPPVGPPPVDFTVGPPILPAS
ncbi:hypothetical protein Y032_0026g1354 [Ancylostoma ceylanicum]|uniref:Uncharacterized protein n=1 Tax=Ancylostoma ceylanicum TaxID=53326 RepID=A0A016UU92_9BILA|nr:hypothetical protein Y032_0026g1354 [Ancylostoma ceylanicum]